ERAGAQPGPQGEARPGAARGPEPAPPSGKAGVAAGPAPKPPTVELVDPAELVLGSAADKSPGGYRLEVRLDQNGAGVDSVVSSRYDAELEGGVARKRPLELIRRDPKRPRSLTLNLSRSVSAPPPPAGDEAPVPVPAEAEEPLDSVAWEVSRDDQGRIVHPESRTDAVTKAPIEGQSVTFRTK